MQARRAATVQATQKGSGSARPGAAVRRCAPGHSGVKCVLAVFFAAALVFPLAFVYLIVPTFGDLLIESTKEDALRVARHLASMSLEGGASRPSGLPEGFARGVEEIRKDFRLVKLRVYSAGGRVLYSTEPSEEGRSDEGLAPGAPEGGEALLRFVPRGETYLGEAMAADVIAARVPIMARGRRGGAVEIFYDVSDKKRKFREIALRSSLIPYVLMLAFLIVAAAVISRAGDGSGELAGRLSGVYRSALRLMAVLAVIIFATEMVVMMVLSPLLSLPMPDTAVLNSAMLVMLMSPSLYFFFFHPLLLHIGKRREAEEKLAALSVTDELTGLLNRRGFFALAERQLDAGRRAGTGALLLFADLDDLKMINDTLGHERGDEALRETAEILARTFRGSDIVARVGGDEFAVLATNAAGLGSEADIVKRVSELVAERNGEEGRDFKISLSLGAVHCEPDGCRSVDELLRMADALMYEDKAGRRQGPAGRSGGKSPHGSRR